MKPCLLIVLLLIASQFIIKAQIQDIINNSTSNSSSSSGGCGCLNLFSDNSDEDNSNDKQKKKFQKKHKKNRSKGDSLLKDNTEKLIEENTYKKETLSDFSGVGKVLSFDLRPQLNICTHKGIDSMYYYINYLPAIRLKILALLAIDFRYNFLTEYNNSNAVDFKSYEILVMVDLGALYAGANDKVINYKSFVLGYGSHVEFSGQRNTSEQYYLGIEWPYKNGNVLDANLRICHDNQNKIFPFFEIGGTFNFRFINIGRFSSFLSLGADYQNYYQSHDIWAFRGGLLLKWNSNPLIELMGK